MTDMNVPQQFTSRPFDVTAMQWTPGDLAAAGATVGWLMATGVEFSHPSGSDATTTLRIHGDGRHVAQPGDWIVHNPGQGRTFALPAEAFTAAYVPAAESRTPYRIAPWGRWLATRARAAEIRAAAEAAAPVTLDFADVEAITGGVADELVATLAAAGRQVDVTGANEDVADTIRLALSRRTHTSEVIIRG